MDSLLNSDERSPQSSSLNHSQKIIIDNENECHQELLIHPKYDFVMKLLSIGAKVKVITPKNLQDKMKKKLLNALNLYN